MHKVNNDQTECRKCAPGRIARVAGAYECENCTVGEYQSKEGLPYCLPCIPYVLCRSFFPFSLPSDHIMAFFFSLSLIAEVNSGTLKEQPPVSHASLASTKEIKMQLFATIVLLVTPRVEIQMSSASHAFLASIKM